MTKPTVKLIGEDGNIFYIIGKVSKALTRAGKYESALKMQKKIQASKSYDEALCIVMDYVEVE